VLNKITGVVLDGKYYNLYIECLRNGTMFTEFVNIYVLYLINNLLYESVHKNSHVIKFVKFEYQPYYKSATKMLKI
jgi:hypothetical protein